MSGPNPVISPRASWPRAAGVAITLAALACTLDDRRLAVREAGAPAGILLLPDSNGFLDGSNAAGIIGPWYVFSDSALDPTTPGNCQTLGGFSNDQCSMVFTPPNKGVTSPNNEVPFPPSDPLIGLMCTSGLAARVIASPSTMALDFKDIWGAGIGVDFNNPAPSPSGRRRYDATAHAITGVSFVINSPPRGALSIEFPTVENPDTPASWGGARSNIAPVTPGLNVIRWADVGGPVYLTNPPAFDPAGLLGIRVHVLTNTTQQTPFDFCISSLSALTE